MPVTFLSQEIWHSSKTNTHEMRNETWYNGTTITTTTTTTTTTTKFYIIIIKFCYWVYGTKVTAI
jgi:hypothetical protein